MGSVAELEIDAVASRFTLNTGTLLSGIIFQNQLLKEKEGSLVVHALAHLNLRLPEMRCVHSLTIVALEVLNNEVDNKSLLYSGVIHHFLLYRHLNL